MRRVIISILFASTMQAHADDSLGNLLPTSGLEGAEIVIYDPSASTYSALTEADLANRGCHVVVNAQDELQQIIKALKERSELPRQARLDYRYGIYFNYKDGSQRSAFFNNGSFEMKGHIETEWVSMPALVSVTLLAIAKHEKPSRSDRKCEFFYRGEN